MEIQQQECDRKKDKQHFDSKVNRWLGESVDLENLKRIASLTGGECLKVQDFSKLVELVDQQPVTTTVISERSLWDNGWMLGLLVGLLGLEWIQRRRHDLP